jgi:hypothetical protein
MDLLRDRLGLISAHDVNERRHLRAAQASHTPCGITKLAAHRRDKGLAGLHHRRSGGVHRRLGGREQQRGGGVEQGVGGVLQRLLHAPGEHGGDVVVAPELAEVAAGGTG